MKITDKLLLLIGFFMIATTTFAQGTLPVYYDYLSDNMYLLHPAAAGIGNCGKIRLTAGRYWKDNELQTLSFHTKLGESGNTAIGALFFNDKNGFHSQKGFQGTYAYHIPMDGGDKFRQLSFGISLSGVQNQVDQRTFFGDPKVAQVIQSDFYVSGDVGVAYHYGGISSYFTVKNLFLSTKNNITNSFGSVNLRNFILGGGYFFGDKEKIQFEPSFLLQYRPGIGEKTADLTMKAYKTIANSQFWAATTYRRSFDNNPIQELQQAACIVGLNYGKWMFSYTYVANFGKLEFSGQGFHQITVGLNVFCRPPRAAACPNINGTF